MFGSNHPDLAIPKTRSKRLDKREKSAAKATNWRKVKAAVKRRDHGFCRSCRAVFGCDAHHLLARSLGGKDEMSNLVWTCRECHDAIHDKLIRVTWTEPNRAKTVKFERCA